MGSYRKAGPQPGALPRGCDVGARIFSVGSIDVGLTRVPVDTLIRSQSDFFLVRCSASIDIHMEYVRLGIGYHARRLTRSTAQERISCTDV